MATQMHFQYLKISKVLPNPKNPRVIKDHQFKALVKSIKEFPKMLEIRPIVVNSDMIILGGNMRLKACQEAGLKEIPVIVAKDLTESEQREFTIKDNVSLGEWDWETIFNDWDTNLLLDWGMNIGIAKEMDRINDLHDEIDNVGLPEFDIIDKPFKITISFNNEQDREEFADTYKIKIMRKQITNWSTWWPEKERNDIASLKYE